MSICLLFSYFLSVSTCQDLKQVFDSVYEKCEWGKDENGYGTSGSGSQFENAKPYFDFLQEFIISKNVKSIIDAGCGDWQFSRYLDWNGAFYIGYDAVKKVIDKNIKLYETENVKFICEDFLKADLPGSDLLILKDVLMHLSNENISKAISQFKKFKWVIVVNDIDPVTLSSYNQDIKNGNFRVLDITKEPFGVFATKALVYKSYFTNELKMVLVVDNSI